MLCNFHVCKWKNAYIKDLNALRILMNLLCIYLGEGRGGSALMHVYVCSVRETLWNFIGHSVLLGESFHRTELISVWLWVYMVLEATSDISVRLEMRQIGPITYLSCRSDGPMNLADTDVWEHIVSLYYRTAQWMFTKLCKDEMFIAPHMHKGVLAISAQGRIQGGAKICQGEVPFFKHLFLQTGRLH